MIGVIADPSEQDVIREFFELFKTPWEFYRSHRQYDVLLSAGGDLVEAPAKLVLLYAGRKTHFDNDQKVNEACRIGEFCVVSYKGNKLPIYGDAVTFPERTSEIPVHDVSKECVAYLERSETRVLVRIGYDLFNEIRRLLTLGQPPVNANIPALELHVDLLRNLIIGCGVRLVEVPPVPDGYPFIACLTHDIDHPSIALHRCDHTIFGFLYRAVFGSLGDLLRRRIPVRTLFTNWVTAVKLPLVQIGVAKDIWCDFDDRYLALEKGLCSTFFVIPFKGCPGENFHRRVPRFRAARYGAADIADTMRKLMVAGCEVGLHGIDAWCDSVKAHAEFEEIRRITGVSTTGVRMHWLYYDQESPVVLEKVGAVYDSTIGYNETVGYRVGTTQVYKPLEATRLLELPLHVMDTALFYPAHLGLSGSQARTVVGRMADDAVQFGGCLTVNWHDRSLAPERLWDTAYRDLIQDLRNRGAWFATAGQAIAWFQKRRSVVFKTHGLGAGTVHAMVSVSSAGHLPGLRLRVYNPQESSGIGMPGSAGYVDISLDKTVDTRVPYAATC